MHKVSSVVCCRHCEPAEQLKVTLIDQQFILLDLRCDSMLFCALFPPLSPVRFRFTSRPLAPNLPTGPCKLCCCHVASSQETNPFCQLPESTTSTPELGHTFHSSPKHSRLPLTVDQRSRRVGQQETLKKEYREGRVCRCAPLFVFLKCKEIIGILLPLLFIPVRPNSLAPPP